MRFRESRCLHTCYFTTTTEKGLSTSRLWLIDCLVQLRDWLGNRPAAMSGRAASQSVWLPGMAEPALKEQRDWAWRTAWFFPIVTVGRGETKRLCRVRPLS
jgi:hypothetical protein